MGTAFVGGVRRHPIVGPAFDSAADVFGYDRNDLDKLEKNIGHESTGEWISGLVGEIGPDFVLGGAALGIGRSIGLRAIQTVAAGARTGQMGLVALRSARDAQIAAGNLGAVRPLAVPWAEVLAKTAGGQTAQAAYFGGSEYLRSGSTQDAMKAAALSAAIGSVLEGVPIALGGLTQKARAARVVEQEAIQTRALEALSPARQALTASRRKLSELNATLTTALNVEQTSGNLVRADELSKALTELPRQIAKTKLEIQATRQFLSESVRSQMFTNKPFVPQGFRRTLFDAGRRIGITPESIPQSLGVNAQRGFNLYQRAEIAANLEGTILGEQTLQWRNAALKAIGQDPNTRDPAKRKLLWRIHHEWEKLHPDGRLQTADESRESVLRFLTQPPKEWEGSVGKVSRARAEKYADFIQEGSNAVRSMGARLEAVGSEALMKEPDLLANQVSRYWSHLGDHSLDDTAHFRHLVSILGDEETAIKAMQAADDAGWLPSQRVQRDAGPTRQVVRRIGKFSSFDYARTVPGTGWDKIQQAIPLNDDPWDTLFRYLKAGVRRDHFSRAVGPNGELVDVMQQAVEQEVKGAAASRGLAVGQARLTPRAEGIEAGNLFKNIMDELLDHKFHNEGVIQLTRLVTSFNVASKLALGSIAQLTQIQNSVFAAGVRNSFQGFVQLMNKESRQRASLAMAIPHAAAKVTAGMFESSTTSLRAERFAQGILKYTGFEPLEKMLRLHSYFTGNALFRNDLLKAANGRLRGGQLDASIRAVSELGVDLNKEVGELRRLGPTAYFDPAQNPRISVLNDRVGYRLAQRAQFIPAKSRRPLWWDHPVGRIAFQFKSFALGQSRLIKDSVLAEAALGNIKPLAYWMSLTPLSGAFIVKSKDLFRGRPQEFSDHPVAKTAQLFMNAGGFGLAGDMFYSSLRGDLAGFLTGPTVAQGADIAEALTSRDADALIESGARLPLIRLFSRIIMAGGGGLQMTEEMVDDFLRSSTDDGERVPIDLGGAAYLHSKRKTGAEF